MSMTTAQAKTYLSTLKGKSLVEFENKLNSLIKNADTKVVDAGAVNVQLVNHVVKAIKACKDFLSYLEKGFYWTKSKTSELKSNLEIIRDEYEGIFTVCNIKCPTFLNEIDGIMSELQSLALFYRVNSTKRLIKICQEFLELIESLLVGHVFQLAIIQLAVHEIRDMLSG